MTGQKTWTLGMAFVLLLAGRSEGGPKVKISKAHADHPKLTLGLAIKDFNAEFSAQELPTEEKGIRRFQVNKNSLPDLADAVLVEFQDGKLAYVEATYSPDYVKAHPWSAFTAPTVKKLGTPKTWLDLAGVEITQTAKPLDSAAWSDGNTMLALGRGTADGRDVYVFVLADSKRFSAVVTALNDRVKMEAATAAAAEKQRQEEAKHDAVTSEWESASLNFYEQQNIGSATDVKKAAARAAKAAAAMRENGLLADDAAEDVQEWAKNVKEIANDKTATIFASEGWQDTGLKVSSETVVFVRLDRSQEWSVSYRWGACGPEGYPPDRDQSSSYRVTQGAPSGALICNTGDSLMHFVGRGDGFVVQSGNSLKCRINDSDVGNNSGQMQVYLLAVTATSPPLMKFGK